MIYYKHKTTGGVFAYETESEREKYGVNDLAKMTEQEIYGHLNPEPTPVSEILEHAKNELRAMRAPILDALTGIAGRSSRAGNEALAAEADALAELLLDITEDAALNRSETYEAMQAAGHAAYRHIASGASRELASVFKEITGA